jgi:TM2 domain-containing membrane protein YozV
MNDNKSLILTYIFSLIGGLFGLHHLYLGRTQHALLWFTTFGGFGVGFIYEFLFLLKRYVYEANDDLRILNEYRLKMVLRKSPAWEISRLCGKKRNHMKNQMTIIQSFKLKLNILNDLNLLKIVKIERIC